jgi:hypothetical protein
LVAQAARDDKARALPLRPLPAAQMGPTASTAPMERRSAPRGVLGPMVPMAQMGQTVFQEAMAAMAARVALEELARVAL